LDSDRIAILSESVCCRRMPAFGGLTLNYKFTFIGILDDLRLYDRALSPNEIAGLAGVTVPFDKPF